MIFFWLPIAAGALIGRLCGGRLRNLTSLRLEHAPILLVALAVQAALVLLPPAEPDPMRVLLPLTTAAIVGVLALNGRLPGMPIVLLGAAANLIVIAANGGLMPTSSETLLRAGLAQSVELSRQHPGLRLPRSKSVVLDATDTRLPWLADVVVSPPLPNRKVVSPGDLAIAAGLAYLTARSMRSPRSLMGGNADPKYNSSTKEHQHGAADTIPPWARPHANAGTGGRSWSGGAVA